MEGRPSSYEVLLEDQKYSQIAPNTLEAARKKLEVSDGMVVVAGRGEGEKINKLSRNKTPRNMQEVAHFVSKKVTSETTDVLLVATIRGHTQLFDLH